MQAQLVLSNGQVFTGQSIGHRQSAAGELVFNTGMVGYPESITDPSYKGQILVFTYPLLGNYGIFSEQLKNKISENFEHHNIALHGVIMSSLSVDHSHFKAVQSLSAWLKRHKIPALAGLDTRQLTKIIRSQPNLLAKIIIADKDIEFYDPNLENLVAKVSIKKKQLFDYGHKKRVLLLDTGAKHNIIRLLLEKNVNVLQVPWDYDYSDEKFDGILLANGPGNPALLDVCVDNIKKQLDGNKPIFGICLGHQLLARAAGAETYKLSFGHRSLNQPCVEVGSKKVYITAQNHGYAVDEQKLAKDWRSWFFNANDGSNEGIIHKTKPFFSVQFHPEACPGPTDSRHLFDKFISLL